MTRFTKEALGLASSFFGEFLTPATNGQNLLLDLLSLSLLINHRQLPTG